MLLRQDFTPALPPRMFMEQIMDKLSKCYCFLWDKRNEDNIISITWKDLNAYYNKNTFRTIVRKLGISGLLSYRESKDGITIELVGWDEVSCE